MKKLRLLLLAVMFGFSVFLASPVMAEHGSDKECSLGHKCEGADCEKCNEGKECSECPIASKIMKKAKFFLENAKEIGLSDDQVAQIKAIKLDTKKTGIRMKAEMEIFKMDVEAKMSETPLNVEGLNAMIDQATAGWGAGAKASIATYVKLKALLSEAQMAKAKEIWLKDKDDSK